MKFKEYFKIEQKLIEIVKNITELPVIVDWAKKAIMRMLSKSEESAMRDVMVHEEFTDAFKIDLENTIHYLESLPENEQAKQLRGNYEQTSSNAKKWIQANIKKGASLVDKPEEGLETVYKFKDGYRMVKLTNKDQCSREGTLMGHYVGGYDPKNVDLISLRDKDNNPHVTLEITHKGEIKQIKGKENQAPVAKYVPYIKEYLAKNPDYVLVGDGENIGYIEFDGKWYDPTSDVWKKVYDEKVTPMQMKKLEEIRAMIKEE